MNIRVTIFAVLVLVQFLVPGWMIYQQERTLHDGRQFKFKTAPVDPYDAFRGRYVALRFEAETLSSPELKDAVEKLGHRSKVWVQFEADSNGFARIKRVSGTSISGGDVIIASMQWRGLHLPFDRFYMDETEAETAYRDNNRREHANAYALVRILDGRAALEDLYIENKPIREFLRKPAVK